MLRQPKDITHKGQTLDVILDLHGKWLRDEDSGVRANLAGANFEGADLRGADLLGAYLVGANFRGANLEGVKWGDAPVISDIHKAVYAAAKSEDALDMKSWHSYCGTSHCRAGWVVTLTGEAGKALEANVGTPCAAYAIYAASDPTLFSQDGLPEFHTDTNEQALADMKRLAETR